MNSGQESKAHMMFEIYRTILDIKNDDYDVWIKMNTTELMNIVMRRTGGRFNPSIVNKIIQEL